MPIPDLARRPMPAKRPDSGDAGGTPAWVKAAAVAIFAAGLASVLAVKGLRHAPVPAAIAAPAVMVRPAFAPVPAARTQAPPQLQPIEALTAAPETRMRIVPDEALVPLQTPAQAPRPAAAAPDPAAEADRLAAAAAAAIPRSPVRFHNDIFTRQEPPRRTVVAAPQEKKWIPAPCDWKVSAPGYQCWDTGGLMIKDQASKHIQGGGVVVAPQQGPSGIWYVPGQAQPQPAAPAKK